MSSSKKQKISTEVAKEVKQVEEPVSPVEPVENGVSADPTIGLCVIAQPLASEKLTKKCFKLVKKGAKGCWLLVVGCWLLVVGCWLLVVMLWVWVLLVGEKECPPFKVSLCLHVQNYHINLSSRKYTVVLLCVFV